jgi:alkylation response protein AidB-like acyl-CoA dehydrogenase
MVDYNIAENLDRYQMFIKEFRENTLDPLSEEIEENGKLPENIIRILADADLLRLTLPTEYGGEGLCFSDYWPILEEVAKAHGSLRLLVHAANGFWRMIHNYGSSAQKQKYLPEAARGERFLGFALTEPDTGTGADIRSEAHREGDNWIINGKKQLISFADLADPFHIFAYTDRSKGHQGVTSFLLERDTPGFEVEYMRPTMGLRGSEHGIFHMDNAVLPVANQLGEVGQGLEIAFSFLEISRLSIGVSCLGLAQRFLELTVAFAQERETFGKPLATRQAIQGYLAEMAMDVYALRSIITDAGRKFDQGQVIPGEASIAKLFGLESVGRVSDRGILVFGGIGYTRTYPVERMYRDARAMWFEEGTPTIHKLVIARSLLNQST